MSWTKGQGAKIAIKFTENLIGDVTGLGPPPVGGYAEYEISKNHLPPFGGQVYTASATYSTYTPNRAFDGNIDTQWWSNIALPQWIQVDLGSGKERAATRFRFYSGATYRTRAYDLKGSNNLADWTDLWSGENAASTGWRDYSFANTTAFRYYRWTITSIWTAGRTYMHELELYAMLPVGNEGAFTISGVQPRWVEFPSEELGSLIAGSYQTYKVEPHPIEGSDTILLTMKELGRFQNLEGNLTVNYNAANGSLTGLGGIVQSFQSIFAPVDLIRMPNPLLAEKVTVTITQLIETLTRIYQYTVGPGPYPNYQVPAYLSGESQLGQYRWGDGNNEKITATITSLTITLIHVDDLEP